MATSLRAGTSLVLIAAASLGCQGKSVPPSGGRPAESTSSRPAPVPADAAKPPLLGIVCRELVPPVTLLLGSVGGAKPAASEDEDGVVEVPFSVELGEARARGERFVVGGLETRSGGNFAFVALLDASGRGEKLEFGRVFGDAQPPLVELHEMGALAVVADNDASSVVLKLHSVANTFDAKSVRRGPEISGVRRDAPGFALGINGASALIVWSKLDKGKGRLSLIRVGLDPFELAEPARMLPQGADGEAEAPKLVRRPGGYFLAWIARAPTPKTRGRAAAIEASDAGPSVGVLDEGPSAIELLLLDDKGHEVTTAKRVTPPSAHVTTFDMATAPDGSVLILYRDDRDAPGLDRPSAEAVLVRADGSAVSRTWQLGDSVGLPSLLVDLQPPKRGPWAWVAVEGEREARLGALLEDPLSLGELTSDERLASAQLIAAAGGRILKLRARGTQRELGLLSCERRGSP